MLMAIIPVKVKVFNIEDRRNKSKEPETPRKANIQEKKTLVRGVAKDNLCR